MEEDVLGIIVVREEVWTTWHNGMSLHALIHKIKVKLNFFVLFLFVLCV